MKALENYENYYNNISPKQEHELNISHINAINKLENNQQTLIKEAGK